MTTRFNLTIILLIVGVSWGLTAPLSKIAVSTGHHYLGLLIWQIIIMILSLGLIQIFRKKKLPLNLNCFWRYVLVALLGTILPNSIMYKAYFHLQSGIMSILVSIVPMIAFLLVLVLKMEKFEIRRFLGVLFGIFAIILIVFPKLDLGYLGEVGWILLALLSPLCYAIEGVWINKIGIAKLDPIEVILGASILGFFILMPIVALNGYWITPYRVWGPAEFAITASSLIHSLIYISYIWLIGKAGVIFASQVSYIYTASGIGFSIILLGEGYSLFVWAAVILMLMGLMMVRPSRRSSLS
ncbi:MAG: EamA family transporter [Rhodobacteraceae bacterium]|mgnify:FL=1|nr:EamA family transporter [Paracoccaceae bacterium]